MLDNTKVYYLASPYSHVDPTIREKRFNEVNELAVHLNKVFGIVVYEPIICGHVKVKYDMPTNFEFWQNQNEKFIRITDAVIVYKMDGWETSRGVQSEIAYAKSLNKPVYYIEKQGAEYVNT